SVKLAAGLRMFRQVFSGYVESSRCKGLIDGNINTADPGAIHSHVRDQVPAGVGDRNVHRLSNLHRLLLSGGYDVSCIVKYTVNKVFWHFEPAEQATA